MAEQDLIAFIRSQASGALPGWLRVGIGDDATVLGPLGEQPVVLTTDMLVEGTHFQPGTPLEAVGYKAIARCLSDLAAMAARPLCTLAAVTFGADRSTASARVLVRSMWVSAEKLGARLVGGDVSTSTGPLTICITALGVVGARGAVLRSGAQAGNAVCVTGSLGGSMRGRHLTFTPRMAEALELVDRCEVHAMIDISDGLSTDALHIAAESNVGLALEAAAIPLSDDALVMGRQEGTPDAALRHALNDGEDYELLFCVGQQDARSLAATGVAGARVSIIGSVEPGPHSALIRPDGTREPLRSGGWEHPTG